MMALENSELGKKSDYVDTYTPSLLHSIARSEARHNAGLTPVPDMLGEDVWTGYEFSWINTDGKPVICGLRVRVSCQSKAIVESKSFKLYLMSFANTRFANRTEVLSTLDQDLSVAFQAPVMVELMELTQMEATTASMPGRCLDELDVRCSSYERNPDLLTHGAADVQVRESVYTHLFRTLCPVTGQPDWASVAIEYAGPAIDSAGLLKYLVSFRNHAGFHETAIETIYADLLSRYDLSTLSVYGRFQRRGGLDINPFRSSSETSAPIYRMARQ
ncbi:MAG: NADPH-dependent 7-cyano-7-deazaguanine reductase QueF [Pseudomonadales bacterium]